MNDPIVHLPPNQNDVWGEPKLKTTIEFSQTDLDALHSLLTWLDGCQTTNNTFKPPGLFNVNMLYRTIRHSQNNDQAPKSDDQLRLELDARIGRCIYMGWKFEFPPAHGDGRPIIKYTPPDATESKTAKLHKNMPYQNICNGLDLLLDQIKAPNFFFKE